MNIECNHCGDLDMDKVEHYILFKWDSDPTIFMGAYCDYHYDNIVIHQIKTYGRKFFKNITKEQYIKYQVML